VALILLSILFTISTSSAEKLSAQKIMELMDDRYEGDTRTEDIMLVLIDKNGDKRYRNLINYSREYDKLKKTLMVFKKPADIRNTAYLTYDWHNDKQDDDIWLYLSALKKVKRIASNDKSKSFMGTEFSYYDINGIAVDNWNFEYAKEKDGIVNGNDVWIVIGTPKENNKEKEIKESGYSKIKAWIRKDNYIMVKAKYWKNKGNIIKYMEAKDIKKINEIWTSHEMTMVTTKKGKIKHSTVLKKNSVEYNKKIDDQIFTTLQMERGL
jgi:hypothetical protein